MVEQLKDGLTKMRAKLDELKSKRDELNARQKTAAGSVSGNDALKAFDVMDPTSESHALKRRFAAKRLACRVSRNLQLPPWMLSSMTLKSLVVSLNLMRVLRLSKQERIVLA